MIRRPPRSTQSRSSAASDVYKRQHLLHSVSAVCVLGVPKRHFSTLTCHRTALHLYPPHLVLRAFLCFVPPTIFSRSCFVRCRTIRRQPAAVFNFPLLRLHFWRCVQNCSGPPGFRHSHALTIPSVPALNSEDLVSCGRHRGTIRRPVSYTHLTLPTIYSV